MKKALRQPALAVFILAAAWSACLSAQARVLSEFWCARPKAVDPGTQHNVELAVRSIDGSVVPTGGTFSYNRTLDKHRGEFRPGQTYSNGGIIMSRGGGYCQVSSALYNAVLKAGLMVTERYPHSLYDPETAYVAPGLDAAVSNSLGADFQFLNTTPEPVTISASMENGGVKIVLQGNSSRLPRWLTSTVLEKTTRTARAVSTEELAPGEVKVVREGFDGLTVESFVHYVDSRGNTITRSLGRDTYKMVPEKVMTGPGNPR